MTAKSPLLALPELLVSRSVLSFLGCQDLCRLEAVGKTTRALVSPQVWETLIGHQFSSHRYYKLSAERRKLLQYGDADKRGGSRSDSDSDTEEVKEAKGDGSDVKLSRSDSKRSGSVSAAAGSSASVGPAAGDAAPAVDSQNADGSVKDAGFAGGSVDWKRLYKSMLRSLILFNHNPSEWETFYFESFVRTAPAADSSAAAAAGSSSAAGSSAAPAAGAAAAGAAPAAAGAPAPGTQAARDAAVVAAASEYARNMTTHGPALAHFLFRNMWRINSDKLASYLTQYPTGFARDRQNASGPHYRRGFLREFASQFDFRGIKFEWALRAFIAVMSLPRTSKGVDRIFHSFGEVYTTQLPGYFINNEGPEEDMSYILCFSLVMLSTDLHNPIVKRQHKMLPEQFVRNTENQLQQPAQVLRALYASVRTCPIVWRMTSTHLSGWLTLDEGRDRLLRKKTRQLFCHLKDDVCSLFTSDTMNPLTLVHRFNFAAESKAEAVSTGASGSSGSGGAAVASSSGTSATATAAAAVGNALGKARSYFASLASSGSSGGSGSSGADSASGSAPVVVSASARPKSPAAGERKEADSADAAAGSESKGDSKSEAGSAADDKAARFAAFATSEQDPPSYMILAEDASDHRAPSGGSGSGSAGDAGAVLIPLELHHWGSVYRFLMTPDQRDRWWPVFNWNIHAARNGLKRFAGLFRRGDGEQSAAAELLQPAKELRPPRDYSPAR